MLWPHDLLSRREDAAWRLQKNQRLSRDFVAELFGMFAVIAAHTYDLGRLRRLQQPCRCEWKLRNLLGAGKVRRRPVRSNLCNEFRTTNVFDKAKLRPFSRNEAAISHL